MSHACSVIAANSGGLVEVLKNGEGGILVSDFRSELFGNEIKRLVIEQEFRIALQERAYSVAVNDFNPTMMANRVSSFYQSVIDLSKLNINRK
jgi:glycosyltransferase involved in cell wall biosynthesis